MGGFYRYTNYQCEQIMNFLEWLGFNKIMEDTDVKKSEYIDPAAKKEKKEKEAITYYRLGLTDNNRVSLMMGYSEITMNADGIDNMITQLKMFRDQLQPEQQPTQEKQDEPADA